MSLVLSILSVSLFTISHCVNLGISSFINSVSLKDLCWRRKGLYHPQIE